MDFAQAASPEKAEAINKLNLKGIYLQKENQRFYPKRELAAHVLGFVDLDEKGLMGIERELDSQIRGKSERIVVMADARQRWFDGGEAQRERGASVVLTLDEKVQYTAERELAAAIAKTHVRSRWHSDRDEPEYGRDSRAGELAEVQSQQSKRCFLGNLDESCGERDL